MILSSLDTNILVYAANSDCPEHPKALALLESALEKPEEWILADQVLFEFYKALRNPRIFQKPLDTRAATDRIRFLREESGFLFCCHDLDHWPQLVPQLEEPEFPYQQTHDLLLGTTLKCHGVNRFYTRNLKDFVRIGFDQLINPINP
ncbi:MAG: PIN domain-containing protein [Blastochloris sp.]|nr:PIN domain-containing protein [Blastochloris sp.]